MGVPLILRLKNRIENKHLLYSGGLHSSNDGEEVSADLSDNVTEYNFFIAKVKKWSDSQEETTILISELDVKNFFTLNSASKDYYALFNITVTSDNKVKFQCSDIVGWDWKDNIQLEELWGI